MTATTEVVISLKSKLELASFDFSGIAVSRISTMRMRRAPDAAQHGAKRSAATLIRGPG